jgi:tRNA (guanine-N7-)-methyltransferase
MRRKSKLASRINKCAHLLTTNPEAFCGRWLEEYNYDELHVELGCGKGLFTVETAKDEPNTLLVALEKISNVIVIALERTEQAKLQSVRYINKPADYLTDYFCEGEVSRIYINFCDPWPASRHKKRRLTGEPFLKMYKHVLCPGGEMHFKTDNQPLFEFSLEEFERCGFTLLEVTYNLHKHGVVGVMTDYESKFHEHSIPIYKIVAKPQGAKP